MHIHIHIYICIYMRGVGGVPIVAGVRSWRACRPSRAVSPDSPLPARTQRHRYRTRPACGAADPPCKTQQTCPPPTHLGGISIEAMLISPRWIAGGEVWHVSHGISPPRSPARRPGGVQDAQKPRALRRLWDISASQALIPHLAVARRGLSGVKHRQKTHVDCHQELAPTSIARSTPRVVSDRSPESVRRPPMTPYVSGL